MGETTERAGYQRVVLALNGGPTDPLVIGFGCDLARAHGAEVLGLHVVEVDWRHDLSEDLASGDERASAVLDLAEGIAERRKVSIRTELLQARDVAAALVDEAAEMGADLIVLGLPYRHRLGGDFAIGSVIPYVFENATAGVVVVREPMPAEGRRAEPLAIPYGARA
jgi:nucleotide-binding universal stress UspA family protein